MRAQRELQREAAGKAKRERWPQTTIRIKFPDRTQLEKVFNSSDKIKVIYAFVRETLRDDVKPIKFILYQTPPMCEYKVSDPAVRNISLLDLQLAPSSILLLKFVDDALNGIHTPAPLADFVLSRSEDLPTPPTYNRPEDTLSGSSAKLQALKSKSTGSSETKVPKWFKMGQKK